MSGRLSEGFPSSSPPLRATDLFPDLSEEIDRRIAHAEQRLKFWVMAGVAVNLVMAIMAAIPMIFYTGQLSRDVEQNKRDIASLVNVVKEQDSEIRENSLWRARLEERERDNQK